ncbi:TPA: four helix bundle protein [Patescibacteria group bacterium]|nr:four helix bundle protein [Patescibacteria group bacterium]
MTNDETPKSKYQRDIYDRTYEFAIEVVKFTRLLPKSTEANVFAKQLIRSVTSIAANLQEADGSKTRAEFRHSVSISKKEAKETKLWLKMIFDLYPELSGRVNNYINECEEIIRILASIVIKTQK